MTVAFALAPLPVGCGGSLSASRGGGVDAGAPDDAVAPLPPEDAGSADAGEDAPIPPLFSCSDCADESLFCNDAGTGCVECNANQDCAEEGENPNAVCLPSGTCGCNADAQCAGQLVGSRCVSSLCGCESAADCSPAGPACAPNDECGCGSNADCAGDAGVLEGPVCDTSTGACVECVTDADCTSPNARVCDPDGNLCLPCRVSADCAQNSDGPICMDFGQFDLGIGTCGCTANSDCAGRAGGARCVSDGSPYEKCGCAAASDCAASEDGHLCIDPLAGGWPQCGCNTTADCPTAESCPAAGATCE